MKANAASPAAGFVFAAQTLPQGDGSYVVRPGKPVQKLKVAEVARILGKSADTVRRLYDAGLLKGERPSPRQLVIHASSVAEHLQRAQDPEYWESGGRMEAYRAVIRRQRNRADSEATPAALAPQ